MESHRKFEVTPKMESSVSLPSVPPSSSGVWKGMSSWHCASRVFLFCKELSVLLCPFLEC